MKWLYAFLGALLIFIGISPTLLSTSWGNRFIERSVPGKLSVDKLYLSWFGTQKAQGIDYESQTIQAQIQSVESANGLFSILFRGGMLGQTQIMSPHVKLKPSDKKDGNFPGISGDFHIEDGILTTPSMTLSNLQLALAIASNHVLISAKGTGDTEQRGEKGSFDIDATIFNHMKEKSVIKANLHNFPLAGMDALLNAGGLLKTAVGDSLDLNLDLGFTHRRLHADVALSSPLLSMQGETHLENNMMTLSKNAHIDWTVTPKLIKRLHLPLSLSGPTDVVIEIDHLSMPTKDNTLLYEQIASAGSAQVGSYQMHFQTEQLAKALDFEAHGPDLQLKTIIADLFTNPRIRQINLETDDWGDHITLAMHSDGKEAPFKITSPVQADGVASRLSLHDSRIHNLNIEHVDFSTLQFGLKGSQFDLAMDGKGGGLKASIDPRDASAQIKFSDFSTYVLGAFAKVGRDLPSLIGPTIDIDLSKKGVDYSVKAKSTILSLKGRGTLEDDILRAPDLAIDWTMSEQSYRALTRLMGKDHVQYFEIESPAKVSGNIQDFVYPLDAELSDARYHANLSIGTLAIKPSYKLKSLKAEVTKDEILEFNLTSKVSMRRESGSITAHGKLDKDAQVITAKVDEFPSIFFDAFSQKDYAAAILGPTFSGSLIWKIHDGAGRILFDLTSPHAKAEIKAMAAKGSIMLEEPIKASLEITPKFANLLFKDMDIAFAKASGPATLTIGARGFSLPLRHFNLKRLILPYGRLDLGQIVCYNKGNTENVGEIFKLKLRKDQLITFWFAPLEFSMQQGIMHIDRTEILYNNALDIAVWGDVRFPSQYVDMTLGLTAQAMRKTLGLHAPANYVLQVPLKGPFGDVKLDKGAAISRIALLIARQQGQAAGGVWGTVLGTIGTLADDQSQVPPPKHPFPWEK